MKKKIVPVLVVVGLIFLIIGITAIMYTLMLKFKKSQKVVVINTQSYITFI